MPPEVALLPAYFEAGNSLAYKQKLFLLDRGLQSGEAYWNATSAEKELLEPGFMDGESGVAENSVYEPLLRELLLREPLLYPEFPLLREPLLTAGRLLPDLREPLVRPL